VWRRVATELFGYVGLLLFAGADELADLPAQHGFRSHPLTAMARASDSALAVQSSQAMWERARDVQRQVCTARHPTSQLAPPNILSQKFNGHKRTHWVRAKFGALPGQCFAALDPQAELERSVS
jgi:hypothetical protein